MLWCSVVFLNFSLSPSLSIKKPRQVYYVGGRLGSWDNDHETLGFTHPFFHDLRSRGTGIVFHEVREREREEMCVRIMLSGCWNWEWFLRLGVLQGREGCLGQRPDWWQRLGDARPHQDVLEAGQADGGVRPHQVLWEFHPVNIFVYCDKTECRKPGKDSSLTFYILYSYLLFENFIVKKYLLYWGFIIFPWSGVEYTGVL